MRSSKPSVNMQGRVGAASERHERMFHAAIPGTGMTPGVANSVVAARAWKVVLPGKGMGLPESA